MKRKGPTPRKPWTPLRFSHVPDGEPWDATPEQDRPRIYGNDRYTVTRHEIPSEDDPDGPTMTILGIHTRTRSAVNAHDWRHFQRIKNEICGPEREGVEIYPPESELTDTANEFWLWVLPEGQRLGFGFQRPREVGGPEDIEPEHKGARQRKL